MVDAVSWQLLRVGSAKDKVTLEACVDDLYDDVLVGETDDKSVFWCVTGYISIYFLPGGDLLVHTTCSWLELQVVCGRNLRDHDIYQ